MRRAAWVYDCYLMRMVCMLHTLGNAHCVRRLEVRNTLRTLSASFNLKASSWTDINNYQFYLKLESIPLFKRVKS